MKKDSEINKHCCPLYDSNCESCIDTCSYPLWLVPLYLAIELKKIGFNLPTQNRTTFEAINSKRLKEYNKIWCNANILKENHNSIGNKYMTSIDIPVWEQAFEWFKTKGYIAWLDYDNSLQEYFIKICKDNILLTIKNKKGFTDYQEAKKELLNKLIDIYLNGHEYTV